MTKAQTRRMLVEMWTARRERRKAEAAKRRADLAAEKLLTRLYAEGRAAELGRMSAGD